MSTMDAAVRERLTRAGQRLLELVGHDDGVTGVGVGYRRRGGRRTDEPVVTVMVRKKRRPGLVSRRRMIPAAIDVDGTPCPTDVVQARAVLLSADETTPLLGDDERPLEFGYGISNFSDARPDAGTLGAFVKDNTDSSVNILSANHVIADNNSAPREDPIFQPAELDEPETEGNQVARLKRFVRITGGATAVDAAMAQVDRGIAVDGGYAGAGTAAPTRERPAVGMVVAGDGFGNVWLTRMDTTLRELNATMLPDVENRNVMQSAPERHAKLEKVGRTTGYTAGRVLDTGQELSLTVPGVGAVTYTDLIKTQWMAWNGDSGAMVIRRDVADTGPPDESELESIERIQRIIREKFDPCEILPAIQFAFGVPITDDEELSDDVRDEFMCQSDTGRFLITLTYLNSPLLEERMESRQAPEQQAYAETLYENYQPVITDLMTNPESTRRLEETDGENYFELLGALEEGGVLTSEEREIAHNLGAIHEEMVDGMGRAEVVEYMNQPEVFESVRDATLEMTELVQEGTPRMLDGLE